MKLLLLNGWSASSVMLERFSACLPSSYELHVLDDIYQFELPDIISKIDALITPETVLIGWSLGGMLAMYYSSLKDKVTKPKGLIVLSASVSFLERGEGFVGVKQKDFDDLRKIVQDQDAKSFLRLFTHLLVDGSVCHKADRVFLKKMFKQEALPSWEGLSKGLDYLEKLDLRNIQFPKELAVLFIFGERDVLVDAMTNLRALEGKGRAQFKLIPEMGHFPFGFFSESIAKVFVTFLSFINDEDNVECGENII